MKSKQLKLFFISDHKFADIELSRMLGDVDSTNTLKADGFIPFFSSHLKETLEKIDEEEHIERNKYCTIVILGNTPLFSKENKSTKVYMGLLKAFITLQVKIIYFSHVPQEETDPDILAALELFHGCVDSSSDDAQALLAEKIVSLFKNPVAVK